MVIDKCWFNSKSSSGLVGLAMWKNVAILIDMFKLRYVIGWNFWKSKYRFVFWETDLWRFIALNGIWARFIFIHNVGCMFVDIYGFWFDSVNEYEYE